MDSMTYAQWLDFLSRAFSYPDRQQLQWLESEGIPFLCSAGDGPAGSNLGPRIGALLHEAYRMADLPDRELVEADYIALFELNLEQQPVRLYGGLYGAEGERLPLLQRLAALYREYGLELAGGAEQPDHLTVELEFLSLLYRSLGEPRLDGEKHGKVRGDIAFLQQNLLWCHELVRQLGKGEGLQPFYLSLARLLVAVLAMSGAVE